MKIHKLILTNIGPYLGTKTLDFDLLDNSLFLITGATGAGKTYIFDSICYALYGKTSGENREPDDLKSKFASNADVASIDLYFEYQNKNFHVHKEPIQMLQNKKKTNGEYLVRRTTATGAIYLLPDDKKPIVTTGIDKYITELFGLDFKQFKMTMMIAQGDFYSLINADTKKREEIFRKILNTEKLSDFSKALDEKFKAKEAESSRINSNLELIRTGFNLDGDIKDKTNNFDYDLSLLIPELKNELDIEKENKDNINSKLNLKKKELELAEKSLYNSKANNENLRIYNEENNKFKELNNQVDEFRSKALLLEKSDKASNYKKILDDYNEENDHLNKYNESLIICNKNVNVNKDLLKKLDEALNVAKLMFDENDGLSKELEKIENNISKIDKLHELKELLKQSDLKINELNHKKEDIILPLNDLNDKKKSLDEIINNDSKEIELNNVKHQIELIDNSIRDLKNKKLIIDKYVKMAESYKKNVADFEKKNEIYKAKSLAYDEYEIKYHSSLAGILASNLKDNEPCPVCGSIHHPKKASLVNELSKEELDNMKSLMNSALEIKNSAYNLMQASYSDLNNQYNNIKEFLNDFNLDNVYSKFKDLINDKELEKKPLIDVRNELISYVDKYKKAKQELELIKAKIESIENDTKIIDDDIKLEKDNNNQLIGSIKSLSDASELNEFKLKDRSNKIKLKIAENRNAYQSASDNYRAVEKDLAGNIARLKAIEDNINRSNNKLSKLKIDLENSLNNCGFNSNEDALASILADDKYKELKNDVSKFYVNYEASRKLMEKYKASGYDKLEFINVDELEQNKNSLNTEYELINASFIEINNKYSTNIRQLKLLEDKAKESAIILNQYKELKQLSDVANGKINGKKINFEVYYQLQIFDEILKVASYKFSRMTNGRYEMKAGSPRGGNGQFGLEIDVKDLFNGEVRPVSGLSGGESFQASMALALAFSEIIQFKAGGIELNSMFIDEGFGTLDNEMLESTKKTLLEIGNQTNRRIGIISHIEELVRSIPSKVIVTKTDKGSYFEIKNN